ncbi:MAG: SUMF1/EgtB/PvdO family nonheme iron enzyme [Bacteroidales bacterium]|nr:SUMF1/EgtB/PvdO family nonheme iron enzyme [Bacteroidales bacterium]
MKKSVALQLCLFLTALSLSAQEMTVKDFRTDPFDISAVKFEVKDLSGEACALIKLGLVLTDVVFEGDIVRQEYKEGEWWLYMVHGASYLHVKTRKYLPLRYEFPARLEMRVTYIMQVEVPPDSDKAGPVGKMEIRSNVRDADVYVDGEKQSSILPFVYEGPEGEHRLELKAPGYNTEKTVFAIRLRRKDVLVLKLYPEGTIQLDGVSFEVACLPGGQFKMGSLARSGHTKGFNYNQPAHFVTLRPFKLGITEVTQAQWKVIMGYNPSVHQGDQYPVENISWYEAMEFIKKLNDRAREAYPQQRLHFRLPTEAEWEFAARYGATPDRNSPSGDGLANPDLHSGTGSLMGNATSGTSATMAVGAHAANRAGLFDMSGNVAEWCADWLAKYGADQQENPGGPASGVRKVVRGGSFCDDKQFLNTSYRGHEKPDHTGPGIGFRFALDD